ncbi:MAG: RRXRR domain-containing protein [Desulfobacterales bacterium]|nr:RRXRR domain-containing protein [Desulfobacterales bacterium]
MNRLTKFFKDFMHQVYVISNTDKPLMPTVRFGKVRRMLKSGRAIVISRKPFTIKLLYDTPEIVQSLTLGIDPGTNNIGVAVRREDRVAVFFGELETRTQQITENMKERKAHRMARRRHQREKIKRRVIIKDIKIRYESFGGIISSQNPPFLAFVDKNFLIDMGYNGELHWKKQESEILSAPIEAHYAVTNYCNAKCPSCYMDSNINYRNESLENAKYVAEKLSKLDIFHVALGGGESFSLPWFLELAFFFREKGIIPNVTTNGYFITDKIAEKCKVFGQVNVSIDSLNEEDGITRLPHFKKADAAIKTLKSKNIRTGINCVISRKNYNQLEKIIAYGKKIGANDIEFLRFKPVGRGAKIYHENALTKEQAINLFPMLKKFSWRYKIKIKLDCSFTPFICYHKPNKKLLEYFSILGCDAGNWLIGVDPKGNALPCSFIKTGAIPIDSLKNIWEERETFGKFRLWNKNPDPLCSKCDYLDICKGGCKAISIFLKNSYEAADPECPFICAVNR